MRHDDLDPLRASGLAGALGGVCTAVSGLGVQYLVTPGTAVSEDAFSYPLAPSALVPVSLLYAVFHVLVLVGILGFARSRVAGPSRAARGGLATAAGGTVLLGVAELASIAVRDQAMSDTGAGLVGALFGLGTLLGAVGLVAAGLATARAGGWRGWRRWTPLATGVVLVALLGLVVTPLMAVTIGVYGLCVTAFGVALATQPDAVPLTRTSDAVAV